MTRSDRFTMVSFAQLKVVEAVMLERHVRAASHFDHAIVVESGVGDAVSVIYVTIDMSAFVDETAQDTRIP